MVVSQEPLVFCYHFNYIFVNRGIGEIVQILKLQLRICLIKIFHVKFHEEAAYLFHDDISLFRAFYTTLLFLMNIQSCWKENWPPIDWNGDVPASGYWIARIFKYESVSIISCLKLCFFLAYTFSPWKSICHISTSCLIHVRAHVLSLNIGKYFNSTHETNKSLPHMKLLLLQLFAFHSHY